MTDVRRSDATERFLSAGHRIVLYGAATYTALAGLLVTVGHMVNGSFMPLDGLFVLSAILVAIIATAMLLYRCFVWIRVARTDSIAADGRSGPDT